MSASCEKEFSLMVGGLCPCESGVLHEPSNDLRPAIKDYTDNMFTCGGCSNLPFGIPPWDGFFRQTGASPGDQNDCCAWTPLAGGAPHYTFNGDKNLTSNTCVGRFNPYFGGAWCVGAGTGYKLGIFGGVLVWFGVGPDPPAGLTDTPVGIYNFYNVGAVGFPCPPVFGTGPASVEIIAAVPPP